MNPTQLASSLKTLGTDCNALTWSEAIQQAKLDWTVSKLQHVSPKTGEPVGSYGIYRDDTDAFLGQVGSKYTSIQNVDQFAFVDAMLNDINGAHYVSAGSVEGDQKVFCVAKISEFAIGNEADKHEAFLIVSDWKNSRGSCKAQVSLLREVCSNGMHAWVPDSAMNFRHTTNVHTRMKNVSKSVHTVVSTLEELRFKLQTLANRQITSQKMITSIFDRLFPETEAERQGRNNYTRTEQQRLVAELLESNDNNAFPDEARTPFAVFNAVTNYVDHYVTPKATASKASMSDDARRANSALFGGGAEFKQNALEIILEETADAPMISSPSFFDTVLANTKLSNN